MFEKIDAFYGEKLTLSIGRNQGETVLRMVCKGWQGITEMGVQSLLD
jgi:hypothetical protein